ncbi:MAG: hypothetical protein B9S32_09510 [Verrucomicrobia bacterium Tous-C9LFEB]|nr:MAG: hypothetical protein B9S32_09510 [Verrucomicrobia bacterium Tous-C9LFEB]
MTFYFHNCKIWRILIGMNRGSVFIWPLLLLLLPQVMKGNDTAIIYGAESSTSSTRVAPVVTSPARITSDSAARLQVTPEPQRPVVATVQPVVAPVPAISTPTPRPAIPTPSVSSSTLPPASGKKYTVKPGDNLYRIGKANGTTLEAIKALNRMKNDNIYVGQVLMLPQPGFSYRPPQTTSQPQAQALPTPTPMPIPQPVPTVVATTPAPMSTPAPVVKAEVAPAPTKVATAPITTPANPVSPNAVIRIPHKLTPNEAQARLLAEAENLAKLDLGYDESWVPPGEGKAWDMDCSNTSRYLYKKATGIELPRTASDQYYNLKIQDRAWDVPLDGNDKPDMAYLQRNLRVGDLLFWENTYKPERDPPITHVTIFLGTDAKGNLIMAGSQSSSVGKYGNTRGGPDIYLFDPMKTAGGYSTWLGFVRRKGHFVAFGRPLASTLFVASATAAP